VDPDLPLIQALQAGDDAVLNDLINRHREPLFRFAFRLVRDENAARDVVQETFVRVYFGARKFTPKASVKTWMYAIALNLSRDHVRRLTRRRTESTSTPELSAVTASELADPAPRADETATQRDEFSLLQRGIDELPHRLREALVLFSLEGKSQREAADILGITPKTVELRVYRAKQKLRQWLADFARESAADFLRDQPSSPRLKE
jgi:RNA polymerase sigma factor CnrH